MQGAGCGSLQHTAGEGRDEAEGAGPDVRRHTHIHPVEQHCHLGVAQESAPASPQHTLTCLRSMPMEKGL